MNTIMRAIVHSWSVWNLRAFKREGLDLAFLSAVMILRFSNIILRRSYVHDILNARCRITTTETGRATEVDAWSTVADQGYPALIMFCAYVSGSFTNPLHWQSPLRPSVVLRAMGILRKSVRGLASLQVVWPFDQRCYLALRKATDDIDLENHDPVIGQQDDFMQIMILLISMTLWRVPQSRRLTYIYGKDLLVLTIAVLLNSPLLCQLRRLSTL
ncbi:hypothetical protein GE09DRAFT_1154811 [Coniochaeta sp. 2T2.1]|nr:hypothetical protein GE09DRAFT_1154811 [Coniochaeta sp. 2T2.1]